MRHLCTPDKSDTFISCKVYRTAGYTDKRQGLRLCEAFYRSVMRHLLRRQQTFICDGRYNVVAIPAVEYSQQLNNRFSIANNAMADSTADNPPPAKRAK